MISSFDPQQLCDQLALGEHHAVLPGQHFQCHHQDHINEDGGSDGDRRAVCPVKKDAGKEGHHRRCHGRLYGLRQQTGRLADQDANEKHIASQRHSTVDRRSDGCAENVDLRVTHQPGRDQQIGHTADDR